MNHEALNQLYVSKRKALIKTQAKKHSLFAILKSKAKSLKKKDEIKIKYAIGQLKKEEDSLKSQLHKLHAILSNGKTQKGTFIKPHVIQTHENFVSERADFLPSASRPKMSIHEIVAKQEQFPIRKHLPFVSEPLPVFTEEESIEEPIEELELEEIDYSPDKPKSLEELYEEHKVPILLTGAVLTALLLRNR